METHTETQRLKAMMKVIPKSCPRIFLSAFIVKIVGGHLLEFTAVLSSITALFENSY